LLPGEKHDSSGLPARLMENNSRGARSPADASRTSGFVHARLIVALVTLTADFLLCTVRGEYRGLPR